MANEFSLDDEPASPESAAILEAMPEPQQHAIDASTEAQNESHGIKEPVSILGGDLDTAGVAWDSSIHATGKDGRGVKTASGAWRKKRGVAGQTSKVAKPVQQVAAEQAASTANATATGAAIAGSIFMLGRTFGGEKWTPTSDEVKVQTDAWANYCIAKNIGDFPPVVAVCIAVLGYVGPRLFIPETKERAGKIKGWFSIRVARWRVKRELKKRGIVANVTIRGTQSENAYDSILVNGQPFNEYNNGTRTDSGNDAKR